LKYEMPPIYIPNPVHETCATIKINKQLQSSLIGMQRHQRPLEFIDGPLIFGAAADVEAFGNLVELLPQVPLPGPAMVMADEVEWRIRPGEEATVTDDGQSICAIGFNDAEETVDE
jgi:hypothetical protein